MKSKELSIINDLEDLAKTYEPPALFSEHKRGNHVRYIDASGQEKSGTIEWVQAATESIQQKYIIVPDEEGAYLNWLHKPFCFSYRCISFRLYSRAIHVFSLKSSDMIV